MRLGVTDEEKAANPLVAVGAIPRAHLRPACSLVRRWYGWVAERVTNLRILDGSLDTRGRSLELSTEEADEQPVAVFPLTYGAARNTHQWCDTASPTREKINILRETAVTAESVRALRASGYMRRAAGTSTTSRTLARLADTTPPLADVRSGLEHSVAGALVAEASMRALGLGQLQICPWALREGVILRRIDKGLDEKGRENE
ncbi:hypothetical protein [Corynebacterium durum]|uniref:hypothetical protein n=1 Tax=Corynebacterium durum TaxID=61592 RepID=UPI0026DCC50E|nr:hypothetical protein [Corynebacterium durum]MDO4651276.1 hypothetical protein [Corynebacterium durum]